MSTINTAVIQRKKWTTEETIKLINEYKENEELWDTNNSRFRNRILKDKIIEKISEIFQCSPYEIQRKLHNLRNQATQEFIKVKRKKELQKLENDDDVTTKWIYYPYLEFLFPILMNNSSKSDNDKRKFKCTKNDETKRNDSSAADIFHDAKSKDSSELIWFYKYRAISEFLDEYDRFGLYVASELKNLQNEHSRKRLKSEIRKAIVKVMDDDENGTIEFYG